MAHVDDGELEMLLDGALHLLPPARAELVLRYVETEEGAQRLARAREVHERSTGILAAGRPRMDELPDFAALKARAGAAAGAGPGAGEGGSAGAAGGASPADVLPVAPRRRGVSLLWAASLAAALGLGWMGRGLLQEPGGMGPVVALQEAGADASAPAGSPAAAERERLALADPEPPAPAASAEAEESVATPDPVTPGVVAEAAPAPAQAGRLPAAPPPAAPQVADASPVQAFRRSANASVETTEVAAGVAAEARTLPGVARLREEIPAEADGVAPTPAPLLLSLSPRTPPATWPTGWAESTPPVPGLPVLDVTSSGPYRVIVQELDGGGILEVRYGNSTPSPGARAAVGLQSSPLPVDTVVPWLQGNALRLPRPGGWLELRAPVDEPTLRGWAGFLLSRQTRPPR